MANQIDILFSYSKNLHRILWQIPFVIPGLETFLITLEAVFMDMGCIIIFYKLIVRTTQDEIVFSCYTAFKWSQLSDDLNGTTTLVTFKAILKQGCFHVCL